MDDEELHQHVMPRRGDGRKQGGEGRLAIDQQAQRLAGVEAYAEHRRDRAQPGACGILRRARQQCLRALPAAESPPFVHVDVAHEVGPAEEEIRHQGDVGQQQQAEYPRHRAGRRARAHQRMQRRDGPGEVQQQRGAGDEGCGHGRAQASVAASAPPCTCSCRTPATGRDPFRSCPHRSRPGLLLPRSLVQAIGRRAPLRTA